MTCARRTAAGFTLLELLVVMVIIGIMAAMMTLSVGVATQEGTAEQEINRLENLVRLASEDAVMNGRELGLTFYETEYEFSAYDPETGWLPLAEEEPFEVHRFPPESVVDLQIEGRLVRLALERPDRPQRNQEGTAETSDEEDMTAAADDSVPPQILILSSGDISPPFELRLRPAVGARGIRLRVAENGAVEQRRDEV
jgi:general secretion pathway protein H